MEILKRKIDPVKFGLALTATGQALNGVGGISSVNGAHGDFVTYTVYTGFFMGAAGVFVSTLFTDGSGPPPGESLGVGGKTIDATGSGSESPSRMTRLKALLISALIMVTGLAVTTTVPLIVAGCKSAPTAPRAIAYLTLKDTWSGVKAAMKVYADACVRGKVSLEKQEQIDSAYEKFRISVLAGIKTARFDWSTSTPAEQDALAQNVITLIQQLNL